MYSRKSVEPRMELWGTPALTDIFCEDFPSKATQSHLLLRKEEIWLNTSLEIPYDLSLWRRPTSKTLSKGLDIPSATAWVAPDPLKPLVTLSYTIVKRSAVDQQDLKPYWKSGEISYFSKWSTILLFTSFSKTLLTTEKRLTGKQSLDVNLSPTFLNTGTTNETANMIRQFS